MNFVNYIEHSAKLQRSVLTPAVVRFSVEVHPSVARGKFIALETYFCGNSSTVRHSN
jgi:hypothetical protein